MQQVLFHIPLPYTFGGRLPDEIAVPGFGVMLFLTFLLTAFLWGPRRASRIGLPKEKLQDMGLYIFLAGLAGARILYMIQYRHQYAGKSAFELVIEFFRIDRGGIVFYGSVFGGVLGYIIFRRTVLKRFNISDWKLADAIAPLIALGLAIGRIGCYLNGCCWGQPVCVECQPVPLSAELGQFPLLPAHARDQVVRPATGKDRLPEIRGLQTSTGFSIMPRETQTGSGDPRTVVAQVEPGSAALAAGLLPGDRIVSVNGQPNRIVVELTGPPDIVSRAAGWVRQTGSTDLGTTDLADGDQVIRIGFEDPKLYQAGINNYRLQLDKLPLEERAQLFITGHDLFWELAREWPRGRNQLELVVERGSETIPLHFTPRTVPFFPTQLYETISMLLLVALLLAFQPYRRHDGQVMVVMMLGYAVHRFLNEAIRIEPTYQFGLTLSQWISVLIFLSAIGLELYLRATQPRLPPGEIPLEHGIHQKPLATAPSA